MGNWKLGFVTSLDESASYTAGKSLYDGFGVVALNLDSTPMCRAVGQVNGSPSTYTITCNNITNYPNIADTDFGSAPTSFETDEFNNGFVRFLSGTCKNKVYKVNDTTSNTLVSDTNLAAEGVADNDYFETVTGSCSMTFPAQRNPTRRDFKRMYKSQSQRFPFYEGGLSVPLGWEADDFVIMVYLTTQKDFDRLQVLLNHKLDYKGGDAFYSTGGSSDNDEGIAPMILETGENNINNQYLVSVEDWKIVKDGKRGNVFEIMIHFANYWKATYRGI